MYGGPVPLLPPLSICLWPCGPPPVPPQQRGPCPARRCRPAAAAWTAAPRGGIPAPRPLPGWTARRRCRPAPARHTGWQGPRPSDRCCMVAAAGEPCRPGQSASNSAHQLGLPWSTASNQLGPTGKAGAGTGLVLAPGGASSGEGRSLGRGEATVLGASEAGAERAARVLSTSTPILFRLLSTRLASWLERRPESSGWEGALGSRRCWQVEATGSSLAHLFLSSSRR